MKLESIGKSSSITQTIIGKKNRDVSFVGVKFTLWQILSIWSKAMIKFGVLKYKRITFPKAWEGIRSVKYDLF